MIFGKFKLEKTVQVNDKTRLDCTKLFTIDEAATTLVRIKADTAESYVTVTTDKFLDWQYATAGDKTVSLEVTTDGATQVFTDTLTIISISDDRLFSGDGDLITHEDDILNYVRSGRDSFLDKHRVAQERILTYLNDQRIWDINGVKLTAAAVLHLDEIRDWSKFLTFKIIFGSLSNQKDDVFQDKQKMYGALASNARKSAVLRLDLNGDGSQNTNVDVHSMRLYKR